MNEVAVSRIARVVIDVDPEFGRTDSGQRGAEAVLNRGVERDGDIDILRHGGWLFDEIRAPHEAVFFEHAFLVPDPNVLAEMF